MPVTIRIRPEAVTNGIRALAGGLPRATAEGMKRAAEWGFKDADPKVPIQTGFLKRSGGVKEVTPLRVTYGWDAGYATYVEFGTIRRSARNFARPGYRTLESGLAATFVYQALTTAF